MIFGQKVPASARHAAVAITAASVIATGVSALVPSAALAAPGDCDGTVAFTGSATTCTVPAGATSLRIDARGAQGGGAQGGLGGGATATLAVTPGQVLQVNVGGQGVASTAGFNGGGVGFNGGGGASDVRTGTFSLAERVVVGGGGGGAGNSSRVGGSGGAPTGTQGQNGDFGDLGGLGGTQSAGGTGGVGEDPSSDGLPGTLGQGGNGQSTGGVGCSGAGGGGGLYGGGAGGAASGGFCDSQSGGGGGSSYADPSATDVTFQNSVQAGNGEIVFTPLAAPVFTSANSATTAEQAAMTPFTVTTTGIPNAAISVTSGTLPAGVTLTDNGNGGATIAGTPGAGTVGNHVVTLTADNGIAPNATQAFTFIVTTPPPSGGKTQSAANGCVTPGSPRSIPRSGSKQLMKPNCVTNAGNKIGVTVSAQLRGDMRYYSLYCKVTSGRKTAVSKSNSGAYCKAGSLRIKTYGYKLRLRVTWAASATSIYKAFRQVKTYKT